MVKQFDYGIILIRYLCNITIAFYFTLNPHELIIMNMFCMYEYEFDCDKFQRT